MPFTKPASLGPEVEAFSHHVRHADYGCGAFKINCALAYLPEFTCYPLSKEGQERRDLHGTVHFETKMEHLEHAYREASAGIPASRPVVEMTVPSVLDPTLVNVDKVNEWLFQNGAKVCPVERPTVRLGKAASTVQKTGEGIKTPHVAQLFVQFAPYDLDPKVGSWADPEFKRKFVEEAVFGAVDAYCRADKRFSDAVLAYDALCPLELEREFGLHKGNIFHGALSLHQLGFCRPVPEWSSHRTPWKNLYVCGAGAHPGGGVMGAPGRNCAKIVLSDSG